MRRYKVEALRNVALAGHGGAGKTYLTEALLYVSGGVERMGRPDEGTATTDFDPDETRRGMSINAALAPCEWREHKINLIDTPGYLDFVGEVEGALRVADAALIVVAGPSGVEVGTETAWGLAEDRKLPRLVFVNKMERENADFDRVLESLRGAFGKAIVPLQVPIGAEDRFEGVVDVVHNVAFTGTGRDAKQGAVPGNLEARVQEYREQLMEVAAESDDDLITKYLDGEPLTDDELVRGLIASVKNGTAVPVLCGSASKGIGIQPLLDALIQYAPSPVEAPAAVGQNPQSKAEETRKASDAEPLAALVFKTLSDPYVGKLTYFRVYSGVLKSDSHAWNATKEHDERIGQLFTVRGKKQEAAAEIGAGDIGAVAKLQVTGTSDTLTDRAKPIVLSRIEFPAPTFSAAIVAKTKADEDKLGPALGRMTEEDPTFKFHRDVETGQTVISGMGEAHLDIVVDRLKRKFGVDVNVEELKIPYRETIQSSVKVQGRHKKQTGGRGQFGDCWVEFQPLPRGGGFEFQNAIVGGAIPRQYIPAVEKGIQEAMEQGVLAGFPTVDIKAICYDGSYHDVDSSEMAFKLAGALAFRTGAQKANPVLLEPMVNVEVTVPEQYMGDVVGDMNTKRGRILGMESVGGNKRVVKATAPLSEMARYAIDLRSIARGRGSFTMEPSHYEEVPAHIAQQIVEKAKKEREES
jgi:elongation factor G